MNTKPFSRDFILVVVGQIISLFGNAIIRFALPLYLLNQTGSSALYGMVTACAFLPMILVSPLGGILADRINKRNIMVFLDFFTAGLILTFSLLSGSAPLLPSLGGTLMLLYGIAGAYQPTVQASIPALVSHTHLMAANSVINVVSSLASLLGPILGGILYSSWGLLPVLRICILCFLLSAVMELFIRIPSTGIRRLGSLRESLKNDIRESFCFVYHDNPVIWKILLTICGINLFLSAMITVGLPWLTTEILGFDPAHANRLYGFAEGALAAGGLAGGICAGAVSGRLTVRRAGNLIIAAALCVFPVAVTLFFSPSPMGCYMAMIICCFFIMIFSTIFSVQMLSYVQAQTPPHLIGKVSSVILTIAMCAQPLGNALYGILFELLRDRAYVVILFSGTVSLLIACGAGRLFRKLS